MNKVAIKFAGSTLVLGLTMVGCSPAAQMFRPAAASAKAVRADQQANKLYAQAQEKVQAGDFAAALDLAEKAVELAPRDAGYRMLLGDLYLKNGRFVAAKTSFSDVLSLDPGNARASLSAALAEIALGETHSATLRLDRLAETAAPADLGLAYALAGHPQRAVQMLEPAAREAGATGRVRQNLALAYALAGDWEKARTTAAQDVSPADLGARMEQWAAMAKPAASWTQVASLLGVTPVEDAGQPVRLALAPAEPDAPVYAEAPAQVPVEAPVQLAAVEAPVQAPVAQAAPVVEPVAVPVIDPQPQPAEVQYAAAAATLTAPQPALIRASATPVKKLIPTFAPAVARTTFKKASATKPGRFVVQLGAYSNAASVERAWASVQKRYALGYQREPLSTTVSLAGKGTFHRLAVSGFQTHVEAARLCQAIKGKGGTCFVRGTAGDAPVRWASRYMRRA